MLDINLLRNNFEEIKKNLEQRGFKLDSKKFEKYDSERKRLQVKTETFQEKSNILAKEIASEQNHHEKKKKLQEAKEVSNSIKESKSQLDLCQKNLEDFLMEIPNILLSDVPFGRSEEDNLLVYEKGDIPEVNFKIRDHQEIGELHGGINFEEAVTIAKSRFVVLKKEIARLHRALIQYMLNAHVKKGYQEIYVPYLVNSNSLKGTGQLPKFEEDLFKTSRDLWLIPTAEVCLTNLGRDSILNFDSLPLRYTSFTNCFRQEAGAAGKDTKGLIREHQFGKVELVSVTIPEKSNQELERMCQCVEKILDKLELRYRKVNLCSGDIGFSSSLTFDFEVWMPGQNKFVEVSSCSNCTDFQSRRMKMRIKNKKSNQIIFPHTLNGSGLAIGRTMVAIIENYQNFDGSINIPEALQLYMGGEKKIEKKSV